MTRRSNNALHHAVNRPAVQRRCRRQGATIDASRKHRHQRPAANHRHQQHHHQRHGRRRGRLSRTGSILADRPDREHVGGRDRRSPLHWQGISGRDNGQQRDQHIHEQQGRRPAPQPSPRNRRANRSTKGHAGAGIVSGRAVGEESGPAKTTEASPSRRARNPTPRTAGIISVQYRINSVDTATMREKQGFYGTVERDAKDAKMHVFSGKFAVLAYQKIVLLSGGSQVRILPGAFTATGMV